LHRYVSNISYGNIPAIDILIQILVPLLRWVLRALRVPVANNTALAAPGIIPTSIIAITVLLVRYSSFPPSPLRGRRTAPLYTHVCVAIVTGDWTSAWLAGEIIDIRILLEYESFCSCEHIRSGESLSKNDGDEERDRSEGEEDGGQRDEKTLETDTQWEMRIEIEIEAGMRGRERVQRACREIDTEREKAAKWDWTKELYHDSQAHRSVSQ
jgi:hypothetical protein